MYEEKSLNLKIKILIKNFLDNLNNQQQQQQHSLPQINNTKIVGNSSVFTEYRDTKPSYLKYSRDDVGGNNSINNNDFEKKPMKAKFFVEENSSSSNSNEDN